jgi:cytidine deaminase
MPELLRKAAAVRQHAYAPYSKFQVGAAVLADGRIYAGCNVENSAYPLSVCAERNAVGMAISAGARRIDAIAVVGGSVGRPAAPCGGCRQVLAEFCSESTPVVYASPDGKTVATTVGELLPHAFSAIDVEASNAAATLDAAAGLKEAAAESTRTRPVTRSRAASGTPRSAARVRGTRRTGR